MKEFSIVKTKGSRKYWISLKVTARQWKQGMNCSCPGIQLFSGYWYKSLYPNCNYRDIRAYGKINPTNQPHKIIVKKVRGSYLVRKLLS